MVGSYSFNKDIERRAIANMIILPEYPLEMFNCMGFTEFCIVMQPLFNVVYHNTIKADIMKLYKDEKEKTMNLLSKNQSRIATTCDTWTSSNQNKSYMTITTHFVDDSWTLQSQIVIPNFVSRSINQYSHETSAYHNMHYISYNV